MDFFSGAAARQEGLGGAGGPLNPLALGRPTTGHQPPQLQPQLQLQHQQHPGNGAESEKFPDLCLLSHDDAQPEPTASTQQHIPHQLLSTSSPSSPNNPNPTTPTQQPQDHHSPTARALRTASIISSAPSDFSVSVSDTSTRATTPTLDEKSSPELASAPAFGPTPPPHSHFHSRSPSSSTPRSRRAKKELNAARVQRSATQRSEPPAKDKEATPGKRRRFLSSATGKADALAAVEPAHEQGLVRMAFAEQQRWITVQQKTFTKWWVSDCFCLGLTLESFFPLVRWTILLTRVPFRMQG